MPYKTEMHHGDPIETGNTATLDLLLIIDLKITLPRLVQPRNSWCSVNCPDGLIDTALYKMVYFIMSNSIIKLTIGHFSMFKNATRMTGRHNYLLKLNFEF